MWHPCAAVHRCDNSAIVYVAPMNKCERGTHAMFELPKIQKPGTETNLSQLC